ncbi:MAG: hypothetical protein PHQ50_07545 [Eubacteriales bacterium]|nr:hypothetical protein [Eubacteriales bacterium]
MISLSSVVKAGTLCMVPGAQEESNDGMITPETPSPLSQQNSMGEHRELIIQQALKKSQYIDNEAMKRADSLIEGAYKKCQQIMLDAEKKGFADGLARGMVEGEKLAAQKAEEGLSQIHAMLEIINAERAGAIMREEKDLISLAFEIAQKILRKQAEIDEDIIVGILEEVIAENQEELKIFLSGYNKTLDFHLDKNIAKRIKALSKNTKVVIVQGDDVILAETPSGMTDLSVSVQLKQLEEALGVEE